MSDLKDMIDELDARSEPVREILGTPPAWTIQWGISVIFLFVLTMIGFSWLIKFPDVIPSSVVITTQTPPVSIVAQSSGNIDQLLVKEGEQVQANQILAVLDNPANTSEVLQLEEWLVKIQDSLLVSDVSFHFPKRMPQLGELQDSYTLFDQRKKAFHFLLSTDPAQQEIQSLFSQIQALRFLKVRQSDKAALYVEELTLSQKDFERNQQLFAKEVISSKQLEDKEREFLQAKEVLEESRLEVARTEVQISGLNHRITQLKNQDRQTHHQERIQLIASYDQLLAAISVWKQRYLLLAPHAGSVSFFKFWSEQQYVQQHEEVLTLIPEKGAHILGKLRMPIRQSGKVQIGQRVNIRLANYPFDEYGMLHGTIQSISSVPRDEQYVIEVSLDQGLKTSFGKTIPFRQEMKGQADIITEDLRLIQRIFYQIRAIFHQP